MQEDARQVELSRQEMEAIDAFHEIAVSGDYYGLLGVSPDASEAHIRRSYYELSRAWHPDRFYRRNLGEYKEKLEKVFIVITRAYSVLSNAEERARYHEDNKELISASFNVPRPHVPASQNTVSDLAEGLTYEVSLDPDALTSVPSPSERSAHSPLRKKKRRRAIIPGLEKLRRQAAEQIAKGRRHHRIAVAAAEEGNWMRASAAMHLASRYDTGNAEYRRMAEEYRVKSREQAAQQAIQAAENAESYHNIKAAIFHYEKACKCDPSSGLPFYRLAMLKQHEGEDEHVVLNLLRTASEKQPKTTRYRLALASYYAERKMKANARREYQAVLQLEPGNDEAKNGLRKVRS